MSKAASTCASSRAPAVAAPVPRPARPSLGALLAAAVRRIGRPWRRAAAIRELSRLGDRMLLDMGIERHALDDVVDALLMERERE